MQGREATDLMVESWHTLLVDADAEVVRERARQHFMTQSRELWPADLLSMQALEFDAEDSWMRFNR
jgi:hypothetical protein